MGIKRQGSTAVHKNRPSSRKWRRSEDLAIVELVSELGTDCWTNIAALVPSRSGSSTNEQRSGKQCRERWHNQLKPDIKKGPWTSEEEAILVQAQQQHGNKWSKIAGYLPGRTENNVKNHWNAARRRLVKLLAFSSSSIKITSTTTPALHVMAPEQSMVVSGKGMMMCWDAYNHDEDQGCYPHKVSSLVGTEHMREQSPIVLSFQMKHLTAIRNRQEEDLLSSSNESNSATSSDKEECESPEEKKSEKEGLEIHHGGRKFSAVHSKNRNYQEEKEEEKDADRKRTICCYDNKYYNNNINDKCISIREGDLFLGNDVFVAEPHKKRWELAMHQRHPCCGPMNKRTTGAKYMEGNKGQSPTKEEEKTQCHHGIKKNGVGSTKKDLTTRTDTLMILAQVAAMFLSKDHGG